MVNQDLSIIFRDPIWTFVAAIVAVLALIVTIIIFVSQKRKKSLSWVILSRTELLNNRQEIEGKIKILFEDKEIKDVSLIIIRMLNSGNVPIAASDYEENLRINFGENAKIILAEITSTNPEYLPVTYNIRKNLVEFFPSLLNSKDGFTLKILASEAARQPAVSARILGIRQITKLKEGSVLSVIFVTIGMLLMMAGPIYLIKSNSNFLNFEISSFSGKVALSVFAIGYLSVGLGLTMSRRFSRIISILHRHRENRE